MGGIIGTVPFVGFNGEVAFFNYSWAGIYSLVVGLLLILIEYPRGRRMKGSVLKRRLVLLIACSIYTYIEYRYSAVHLIQAMLI